MNDGKRKTLSQVQGPPKRAKVSSTGTVIVLLLSSAFSIFLAQHIPWDRISAPLREKLFGGDEASPKPPPQTMNQAEPSFSPLSEPPAMKGEPTPSASPSPPPGDPPHTNAGATAAAQVAEDGWLWSPEEIPLPIDDRSLQFWVENTVWNLSIHDPVDREEVLREFQVWMTKGKGAIGRSSDGQTLWSDALSESSGQVTTLDERTLILQCRYGDGQRFSSTLTLDADGRTLRNSKGADFLVIATYEGRLEPMPECSKPSPGPRNWPPFGSRASWRAPWPSRRCS